jgi:hypothetical protein
MRQGDADADQSMSQASPIAALFRSGAWRCEYPRRQKRGRADEVAILLICSREVGVPSG